jgi:mono/diheme cytochrome c family protein
MKRSVRIAGITVVAVALLVASAITAASWMGDRKKQRVVKLDVAPVAFVDGADAIARGKYLYNSRGCMECHGVDGKGRVVIDDPNGMLIRSPNITTGPGGAVAGYTESDWVRSIRHGITPKGHAVFLMPSEDYNRLTDPDLAALVAYVRSLPPVDGEERVIKLPLMVKALYGIGAIHDASEKIDHASPPPAPIAAEPTVAHGAYVVNMCMGCHGPQLKGGKIPGTPPDWPPAANLTADAGSVLPRYGSIEQFKSMLRTGKRPDGSAVSTVMPFATLRQLNDTDIEALYAYLKAQPAHS